MEIGVALPNIGPSANREVIFGMADRADELGIDTVWTGDHLAFPYKPQLPYPYSRGEPRYLSGESPVLDPLVVMAAIIGRTKRVRVGVSVLILPYRHPLVTAKMLASMDAMGPGRVVLGIGVGWIPEEFAAVNADIKKRGAESDEQLRYFKELWANDQADHKGEFYQFSGLGFFPKPAARSIPIWVGGNSAFAMRRAARLGDGLHFIDLTRDELSQHIEAFKRVCEAEGRDIGDVVLSIRSGFRVTEKPLSDQEREIPFAGTPGQIIEDLQAFKALGVRHVCLGPRPRDGSAEAHVELVEVIGKEIVPALKG